VFRDASDALDALRLNPHVIPRGARGADATSGAARATH